VNEMSAEGESLLSSRALSVAVSVRITGRCSVRDNDVCQSTDEVSWGAWLVRTKASWRGSTWRPATSSQGLLVVCICRLLSLKSTVVVCII